MSNASKGSKVPPRVGKTQRDRANGAKERTRHNRDVRAAWVQEVKGAAGNRVMGRLPFPLHTCNGKKSRSLKEN